MKIEVMYEADEGVLAEADSLRAGADEAAARLYSGELAFTGWARYAKNFSEEALSDILETADEIASRCKYFVVIGIGGSYLGAKAALSFIDKKDSVSRAGRPEILFAGFNLSGAYHADLIDKLKDGDICLLIISKSGGTLEPSLAFLALKNLLIQKYGRAEALSRIYAITDAASGKLRAEADKNGYKTFALPSDIGGRFSVLTPVGLLPLAVAGVDIRAILAGARAADEPCALEDAKRFACVRAALEKQKCVETFCFFDPSVEDFTAWALQLFGESEGKDGRGVLPTSVYISRDLHSLGQFFQDGKQVFYETMLFVNNPARDLVIADADWTDEAAGDAGDYAGRAYSEFCRAALEGTAKAHRDVSVPIIRVYIPDGGAFSFGQLVYLFEMTCAITGLLMGVNPFDQPGVEAYKKGMLDYLAANARA